MAWTVQATVIAGELMLPAFWNAQVKDNNAELRAGGLALASQAAGDLFWASSASALSRMAAVEKGVPFYASSVWTVSRAVDVVYPIGTILELVVSTNPGTLLGVGTWSAYGSGRILIGVDTGDVDFNAARKTGGAKTHALSVAEMPVHAHGVTEPNAGAGHPHEQGYDSEGKSNDPEFSIDGQQDYPGGTNRTSQSKTTGITVNNAGSGTAHNNLQPYLVVYRWERVA